LLLGSSRNVRKFSILKAFAIYPHRLWINLCMAASEKCAIPLLQAHHPGW